MAPPRPPIPAKPQVAPAAAPEPTTGIRSPSIVIDGKRFTITTVDADTGLEISPVILDYVTGPLAAAVMALGGLDQAAPTMLQALGDLTGKLRDPSFRTLVWKLLEHATVDGRKVPEPLAFFASNYGVLARLALFAIRENFGSFLDVLPPAQREAMAGRVALLLSRAESTLSQPSSSSEGGPPPKTSAPAGTSPT